MLEFLNPGPNGENLVFVRNETKNEEDFKDHLKPGRPRKISPRNKLFLFLCSICNHALLVMPHFLARFID
jgi:hypothetical protein